MIIENTCDRWNMICVGAKWPRCPKLLLHPSFIAEGASAIHDTSS